MNSVYLHKTIQKKIQEIKRAQSILLLQEKVDEKTILQLTGLKRSTAKKLRRLYQRNGLSQILSKVPEKPPRSLFTKTEREKIGIILGTKKPRDYSWDLDYWNPTIAGHLIQVLYGVKFRSKTSIHLLFKQAKHTYHKPEKKYKKRDPKAIQKWRKENEPIIQAAIQDPDVAVLVEDEMIITT
jgi:transposase